MVKHSMGEFLGILRKASGYTQQEVAEKLNVSNRTLSSWETDRTTPDILLLPAIADLYGVTVDELIRGERGAAANQAEITESALHAVRKRHFGIFHFRCIMLDGFGCLSVLLTVLACILNLCTPSPLWLDILIAVLGAGGFIACTTLLTCFYVTAKHRAGIIVATDYTKENSTYVLALRQKAKHYYWICAAPLFICAIALLIAFIAASPKNTAIVEEKREQYTGYFIYVKVTVKTYLKTRYIIAITMNAVLGAALLAIYFIYGYAGVTAALSDEQKVTRRRNIIFAAKICGFEAIPVVIAIIIYVCYRATLNPGNWFWEAMPIISVTLIPVSVAICIIIYAAKRKKQNYDF